MQRLLAASLPVVLQVGALWAPLVHAHLDGHHDDHHDAPTVHAHMGGHAADHHDMAHARADDAIVVAHDDPEHTTRLQIFVAVTAIPFTAPGMPPARFALTPAPASVLREPPEDVRSHGPPDSGPAESRAPPAPSVLI